MRLQTIKILGLLILLSFLSDCKSEKKKEKKNKPPKPSMFDKLSNNELLEFELAAPFDSLILGKDEEQYFEAELSLKNENDSLITEKIKVSARGKTRKKMCDLPPLKLKFPKNVRKKSGLANFKTLKLVTPCKEGEDYQDLIKKELLCYQMYQALTDKSFRALPANIQTKQIGAKESSPKKLAFLIEHEKEMARRLGGELLDKSVAKVKIIDIESYNLLTLFQYMIGNTDWNLSRRHNIKLVKTPNNSAPIPVPYDFDYSGLVNAKYAIPHPNLPIKTVRERMFQWRGKDPKILQPSVDILLSKKETLLGLINACQLKNKKGKAEMLSYVNEFFDLIESEGGLEKIAKK